MPRENEECQKCRSRERHRLLYFYLKQDNFLFAGTNKNFLHFAPEYCLYQQFKKLEQINYTPCDLNPHFYRNLKTPIVQADITAIPYGNNMFDFIMCNHVLEHIENDQKALAELYRVMKPGGRGIFLVPIDERFEKTYEDFTITAPTERERAFGQSDHVRICGRDYLDRYREAGFKVTISDFGRNFSSKKRYKYGILPTQKIYLCEKEAQKIT
ncbi:class I SAM-dependent methyltransferase [Salinimicrobium sp. TH3]|uniref:class I SAM-dependent methyltransferase n=1 Tax=Salinimicrobium sp. TH3 TaxID=2997342 RepID=UPI002275563D|nr:class I SAM-dependent methyltransferase [Salinimicrobium sp. TH3]MCY2687847.1 class I SAM-dependent methyltransferase [Salinimicrobium sp. TH3]